MSLLAAPDAALPALRAALLAWFDASGRDLPWRSGPAGQAGPALAGQRDPYRVWVAEILLQQTQVARGRQYYQRFLDAFPSVQALAAAPQDDVLKAWEGCGYYARARNLHKGARQVAQSGFPTTYEGWLAVPGVGSYTAAAIASLAYGEARAVNDGNVRRVLSRLYAVPTPTDAWVARTAQTMLDPARPGDWNEAVMDLGATVCTPRAPQCGQCPLQASCAALASGTPSAYPAPKVRAQIRDVQAVAVLIGDEHHAVLEQRQGKLLGGLMGLPTEERKRGEDAAAALNRLCQRLDAVPGEFLGQVTHTMTHRRLNVQLYRADSAQPRQAVAQAALSRLDQKAVALLPRQRDSLFGLEE